MAWPERAAGEGEELMEEAWEDEEDEEPSCIHSGGTGGPLDAALPGRRSCMRAYRLKWR